MKNRTLRFALPTGLGIAGALPALANVATAPKIVAVPTPAVNGVFLTSRGCTPVNPCALEVVGVRQHSGFGKTEPDASKGTPRTRRHADQKSYRSLAA